MGKWRELGGVVCLLLIVASRAAAQSYPTFTAQGLDLNGKAAISNGTLELTNGNAYEASTAFYTTVVPINVFTTDFDFLVAKGATGDGLTFAISGSPTALGTYGSNLGIGGLSSIVAVSFAFYQGNTTGLWIGGSQQTVVNLPSSINLKSGDSFHVQLAYDGVILSETITDNATLAAFSHSYTVNIPLSVDNYTKLVNSGYVGFSGATGSSTSTQQILDWSYSASASPTPTPTATVTATPMPTATSTATNTATSAPTPTTAPTSTFSAVPTPSSTQTPGGQVEPIGASQSNSAQNGALITMPALSCPTGATALAAAEYDGPPTPAGTVGPGPGLTNAAWTFLYDTVSYKDVQQDVGFWAAQAPTDFTWIANWNNHKLALGGICFANWSGQLDGNPVNGYVVAGNNGLTLQPATPTVAGEGLVVQVFGFAAGQPYSISPVLTPLWSRIDTGNGITDSAWFMPLPTTAQPPAITIGNSDGYAFSLSLLLLLPSSSAPMPTVTATPTSEPSPTPTVAPTATSTATATPASTPTPATTPTVTPTTAATPTATPTPVSGAIVMPIEVIGPQGETGSRSFNLTSVQASSAVTFWLQGNNLGYRSELQTLAPGKASISLNGGPWLALTNETVTVLPPGANYEGIDGGIWATVKATVPISTLGSVIAGANTVSFRQNQTDGVTTGFRILAFNLLDSGNNQILAASNFVDDDPTLWTAPLNDSADISAGQTLWHTAPLAFSSINSATMNAHCSDCHAQDGRDLKYFNYSNYAIIQRSTFHGLSQIQGEQIASYIRSGIPNAPAFSQYARPWNPPYQPGPGLNLHSITDWSAGAGIQWVLDDDTQTLNYVFPNGYASGDVIPASSTPTGFVDKRDVPIFLPLPSWNQWLPSVSPMDAYGTTAFDNSGVYYEYENMRSNLTSNLTAYVTNHTPGIGGTTSTFGTNMYSWDFGDRQSLGFPVANPNPVTTNYELQIAHWQLVKSWEVMQEFNLESLLAQSEGFINTAPQDDRVWNAIGPFFTALFRIGIPTDPNGGASENPFYGDQLKDSYFTSSWYYLQIILHSGQHVRGGNDPIDWGYYLNHQGKESSLNLSNPSNSGSGLGYAGLMTMVWLNSEQENTAAQTSGDHIYATDGMELDADYGFNPAWGAAFEDLVFPEYFGYGAVGPWANLNDTNKGNLLGTLGALWLSQADLWTPAQWDAARNDDGTSFGEPTHVCNTNGYGSSDAGDRMYAGMFELTNKSSNGDTTGNVPTADIEALATWAETIWPTCNWSQF